MKLLQLIIYTLIFTVSKSVYAEDDKYVKLANKVTLTNETDSWIKVSVPLNIIAHPRLEQIRNNRPSTIEEAFNPEYIEGLKVKLYLCFSNEFKKKALRTSKLIDSQFYQYYSAEVNYETIKLERTTVYVNFMFPSAIADRDGFGGNYINPVGYVIEVILEGVPAQFSNSIMFESYRDEATLLKFKQQAQEKSNRNKDILVPAHHVFQSYYPKGSYLKPSISGN